MAGRTENEEGGEAKMYLVVHNVQSKANIGMLTRCAVALGCAEVVVAGAKKIREEGSHGSAAHISICWQPSLQDAMSHLRQRRNVTCFLGLEITRSARYVHHHPFPPRQNVALLVGNEGDGLSPQQRECCTDGFLQVPQHGTGTASLPVVVSASIAIHHFALFAQKAEGELDLNSEKYVVKPPPEEETTETGKPLRRRPLGKAGELIEDIKARRAGNKQAQEGVDGPGDEASKHFGGNEHESVMNRFAS